MTVPIGAIRWDGWNAGPVGTMESLMLSPRQWARKLPFFATYNSPTSVTINGNTVAIAEAQNVYAHDLGLSYWMFADFPNDPDLGLGTGVAFNVGMASGLTRYLASSNKSLMKFCLNIGQFITATGTWQASDWTTNVNRYVSLFQDSQYMKVLGSRPLLFNFYPDTAAFTTQAAGIAAMGALRDACATAGVGDPYIVQKFGDTDWDSDAISDYAFFQNSGSLIEVPYSTLTSTAEGVWPGWVNSGQKVVPLCMAGWDYRPRHSSDNTYPGGAGENNNATYTTAPTRAQLLAHLAAGQAFCVANPVACEAQVVLTYAWNEFSEGGIMCPPRPEPKLIAIS